MSNLIARCKERRANPNDSPGHSPKVAAGAAQQSGQPGETVNFLRDPRTPKRVTTNRNPLTRTFVVAGAGFEPATFGL